jgi:hypothetical protein
MAAWAALVVALSLATRALAYAVHGSPAAVAAHLRGELGGPRPMLVALVALGLAAAVSTGLVWLAALGARERWALAELGGERPRVPLARLARRSAGLWVATCLAFAALESYLHWRAGLGFHGLHCLVGPVHQDVLPLAGALALLAAAALTAAGHLLSWMRRRVAAAYRARPPLTHGFARGAVGFRGGALRPARRGPLGARGPPLLVAG